MQQRKTIAVNTRFLIKGKLEGIGLFTYESLKRIVTQHPDYDFYFLFDRPYHPDFVFAPNVHPVVLFPPARHPFLWVWWFEWSVARWLNKHRPALFLSTDGYACLRTQVPQVAVMHDLAFEHFSQHVPRLTVAYYRYFLPRFAQKATRIATVSQFSKSDIIKHYRQPPSKIDVVYNGAKEVYQPLNPAQQQQVRNNLCNGAGYFVYVGSIHPRKNVANLLRAFDRFKAQTQAPVKLVIVGRKAWQYGEVDEAYRAMQYQADVVFTGHVAPEQLANIVGAALGMVYVSLFEGFGIPIVEAMACRVPVITSNTTSMPEAAGKAALLVNPTQVPEIADAMQQLYQNEALRNQLIAEGEQQLKKFSWQQTADKLWQSCLQALAA